MWGRDYCEKVSVYFIGVATDVEKFPNHEVVEFRVNKSWKGANEQMIEICNSSGSNYPIKEDAFYIIFAKKKRGEEKCGLFQIRIRSPQKFWIFKR